MSKVKYKPDLTKLRDVPKQVLAILELVEGSGILWKAAERAHIEDWDIRNEVIEFMMGSGPFTNRKTPQAALMIREVFWTAVIVGLSDRGRISLRSVCKSAGISYVRFYQLITENRLFVVWLTRVPIHNRSLNPLFDVLINRLEEVTHLSPKDDRGRLIRRNVDRINRAGEVLAALRAMR